MALTLRGNGQVSADNYGIDSDGSITATGITSTGNVGIGTSSPTSYANYSTLTLNDTNGGVLEFKKGNTQVSRISNANDQALQFVTANTERMRIDASGRVTTPYQPSFRAGRNGNYVAGMNNDILFNLTSGTQLFNTGGHYSTSTGLFTAPITGSYLFHAVVIWGPSMPEGHDMADSFRLVYNGTKFHYSEKRAEYVNGTTGNGGYYVDHATCLTHMNTNDTLGVRSQETVGVHGNAQYTTFQGHLLG